MRTCHSVHCVACTSGAADPLLFRCFGSKVSPGCCFVVCVQYQWVRLDRHEAGSVPRIPAVISTLALVVLTHWLDCLLPWFSY